VGIPGIELTLITESMIMAEKIGCSVRNLALSRVAANKPLILSEWINVIKTLTINTFLHGKCMATANRAHRSIYTHTVMTVMKDYRIGYLNELEILARMSSEYL
jgi:hypothetical protein